MESPTLELLKGYHRHVLTLRDYIVLVVCPDQKEYISHTLQVGTLPQVYLDTTIVCTDTLTSDCQVVGHSEMWCSQSEVGSS